MNPPENPFDAPWQAQAFAMTLALHQAGLFTWPEWAAALGKALEGAAPDGSDYYACWLSALEAIVTAKAATTAAEVDAFTVRRQAAAHATPHGAPIRLENTGSSNFHEL